ncbi:hypothetical protein LOD99_5668 [Oopsacas minuta]|uniref:Transposase Tc1-like domain-containing protein n=1 Tax=Oopsacas minuta TaxID=111878 RepID=A0AAV7JQU1_9METZ|nr:hypothetical protein LOD99_5668 [Oopsacas minuta]
MRQISNYLSRPQQHAGLLPAKCREVIDLIVQVIESLQDISDDNSFDQGDRLSHVNRLSSIFQVPKVEYSYALSETKSFVVFLKALDVSKFINKQFDVLEKRISKAGFEMSEMGPLRSNCLEVPPIYSVLGDYISGLVHEMEARFSEDSRDLSKLARFDAVEWMETGSVISWHKRGAGRPSKIEANDKRRIAASYQSNPRTSLRSILPRLSSPVSISTLHTQVKRQNFVSKRAVRVPALTDLHVSKRIAWCKEMKCFDWSKTFFTDECSVWLDSGRVNLWIKKGQTVHLPTFRHPSKVHLWGGISIMGTTHLRIFPENFNQVVYISTLRECLIEEANAK